ncbi:hypothetical protein CLU83_2322 [Flavobacterium sp. 1]|nr:hypothetical protein CLU83_2322 [Flavobacterium sp. 1]
MQFIKISNYDLALIGIAIIYGFIITIRKSE